MTGVEVETATCAGCGVIGELDDVRAIGCDNARDDETYCDDCRPACYCDECVADARNDARFDR